jgi:hypothetical protein
MLKEFLVEEVDICRELENYSDLNDGNIDHRVLLHDIDYDNFDSVSEQNFSDKELEKIYIDELYYT